jgi:predicted MFS family arabinose efflux permease
MVYTVAVAHGSWRSWYALGALTLVYISNIADRYVISTLIEPIKADLQLSDTAIGFLTGTALAIFYTGMGIPLGLIADRVNRRNLIALSIGVWSIMTAACGVARTFAQLLIARIGVGIGEAGGTPASQSMISDLFPLQQRALATSIFALGAAAGSMLGSTMGGAISDAYGWRWAFLALGIPGVIVALIVRFTLREPPRGTFDTAVDAADAPTLAETWRFIRHQPSLLHVLAGATVVTFWGWGLLWWTPAFLSRSYGMTTGGAGALMGTINGIAGASGIILGAILTHKWGRRDPRWQAWIVAIATFIGTVLSIVAYSSRTQSTTVWMLWAFVPAAYLNIGPILALTQSLAQPRMRGLVCGLMLFGANIANLAIAPQLIGFVSDLARDQAGGESLRFALIGTAFSGFWAAYHFWKAGRAIPEGLQRAGSSS